MPIKNKGNYNLSDVVKLQIANDWPTAQVTYTSGVIESASNLYFTNARVVSALIAGDNITIEANGRISANVGNITAVVQNLTTADVRETSNLYFTNTRARAAFSAGENIEITPEGVISATHSSTFLATVNTFVGTGSNVTFPLTITPGGTAYTSVIIDGVAQQTTAYSIVGSTIVFTEAPVSNAVIDVRIYSGTVGSSFNTRTFVGNGVANTYAITSGFNAQNILVFENGVAQIADVDYTVDANSVITFATAPAANIVVHIKELGSVSASGAQGSTNARTLGYNLVFGG